MKTLTEGTNLRPVKAMPRDERVLSLVQTDKIYHELREFCLKACTSGFLLTKIRVHFFCDVYSLLLICWCTAHV